MRGGRCEGRGVGSGTMSLLVEVVLRTESDEHGFGRLCAGFRRPLIRSENERYRGAFKCGRLSVGV